MGWDWDNEKLYERPPKDEKRAGRYVLLENYDDRYHWLPWEIKYKCTFNISNRGKVIDSSFHKRRFHKRGRVIKIFTDFNDVITPFDDGHKYFRFEIDNYHKDKVYYIREDVLPFPLKTNKFIRELFPHETCEYEF